MIRWVVALAPFCLLTSCSAPQPTGSAAASANGERQITANIGVARSPVLSHDGSMVAFAAGPADRNEPQIWVVRADGSTPPVKLTEGPSQNYDPEFSPDGQTIYFTSSRETEGIYRVPVSGGEASLAIANAYSAKISPDGRNLLLGLRGKVFQRTLDGEIETEVLPSVDNSYAPVWSPDSARFLVTAKNTADTDPEWWLSPAAGASQNASVQKLPLMSGIRAQGFHDIEAHAWLPGDWIVFSGTQGQTRTLWKVQIDSSGNAISKAVRATDDPQGDNGGSFAAGKFVFSRTHVDMNFWSLPLDKTGEHVTGPPQSLTSSHGQQGQESAAGSTLLYSAQNGDRFSLFLQDAKKKDNQPKVLGDGFYSVLAQDGSSYVYGEGTKEHLRVISKSFGWWPPWSKTLCDDCGMPRGFSSDKKKLLLWVDTPPLNHLDVLDVKSGRVHRVVWSNQDLSGPRLSPDGRWISFVAKMGQHRWQTFVAPVGQDARDERPVASFEWIPIAPLSDDFHFAFWSPHGDIMYTLTSHGGSGNLRWLESQHLDPKTKRPVGGSAPVHEFDETLVPGMDPIWNTVSAVENRIVLELGGVSTNLWIK
jgi:Tol biopolymer transport system component